ncbi:MAG TPA: branched-chain amino acid ABC transporter permease [Methylomirabilota bacterium]|nr:branched-chain amino acid ABC transporter permease [Methylomirabilota bacterium]
MSRLTVRALIVHLAVLALLFALQYVAPDYIHLQLTRVMVLAVYAMGYNLLFGYTGLLSLGHAMFFAAGLYGAALGVTQFGLGAPSAFVAGVVIGAAFSTLVGVVALRTSGVAFMIVTLMFAQAVHLAVLYFGAYTRGDEGLVLPPTARSFDAFGATVDLTDLVTRYNLAFALFAATMLFCFIAVRSPLGRVLVAIRENEPRTTMLGYDVTRQKLIALVLSGTISATAGAAYALMFAYAGASFASIQYSIHPLLWTLVGGAATVLGPFVGTLVMFTLVDVASGYTTASLLAVGAVLIVIVLFFPKGVVGTVRSRWAPWLP